MTALSVNMNVDTGEKTWLTPPHIIDALGPFDIDPCCPPTMPWRTAARMICRPFDGQAVDWTGQRVWLNPPYGREAVPFFEKLIREKSAGVALVFARTDTALWQNLIFPNFSAILFLRGRLRFHRADGTPGETATAPSALIAFSDRDAQRLEAVEIPGYVIKSGRAAQ